MTSTSGNGLRLTSAAAGVQFDAGVGTKIGFAWTEPNSDDAFLALDRNSNGSIDSGKELFGSTTVQPSSPEPNGFLALKVFDHPASGGNSDGQIDSRDSIFSSLRLWKDTNHNGVSESSELFFLEQLGVSAIGLDFKLSKRRDEHGNLFRYRAKVSDTADVHLGRWAWDVFLTMVP